MEEKIQIRPFWSAPAFKYGIIGGVVSSLVLVFYYVFDYKLFNDPLLSNLPLLVFIICSILAGIEQRRKCGGYISFGNLMAIVFGAFMLALIINTVFYLLIFFVIDPDLINRLIELQRDKLAMEIDKGTYPESYLNAFDETLEKTGRKRLMLAQSFGGLLFLGAVGLIISLIIAAILRKEPKY